MAVELVFPGDLVSVADADIKIGNGVVITIYIIRWWFPFFLSLIFAPASGNTFFVFFRSH